MFLKQWRAVIAPIFFGSKIREIFLHTQTCRGADYVPRHV